VRALYAIVLATLLPAAALAADPDPQRVAEARTLLTVLQLEKQIDGMGTAMAQAMTNDMLQGQPNLNQRVLQVTMEESLRTIKREASSPDGLYDALAVAYASQFTVDELRQIREFYQSPVGARALLAAPEVMKQVLPQLARSSRAMAPQVCARAKARLVAEKVAGGADLKCPVGP
jgi:hypothetical protein